MVGAVSIGLIFGLAPADTDLSTIHTQEATSVPEATEPATVEESSSVQESETVKEGTTGISVQLETYSSGNIHSISGGKPDERQRKTGQCK